MLVRGKKIEEGDSVITSDVLVTGGRIVETVGVSIMV